MSDETKCETNYSINNKWNNTRNMHFTKHDTNDDVDLDNCVVHTVRWACTQSALFHTWCRLTSLAQVLSHFTSISIVIHGRTSLTRFSLFTSTCSSLSFYTSCNPICTLSSTTRSSWKACDTPPTRRVRTPRTSPPPSQVMSPISWPSASSTTLQVPSPTLSRHRTRTWMTWHSASCSQRHTEDKPITANRKACPSVSQSSSSVVFDGSGKPDGERNVDQSVGFGVTRNTYSAHSKFSENTQTEKVVDRSGKLVGENSSNAQIRTFLEEQIQMIIAENCEKIGHHELHAARAGKERRILREELWRQQMEYREVHQQSLTETEELRKFQSSTFDTIARRKLIEDQNTILELLGRVQELQNEVNCMNESKDFQDPESVRGGHSHVTSQSVSFPPHPIPGGWDLIVSVLGNTIQTPDRSGRRFVISDKDHRSNKRSGGMINVFNHNDCVPSNVQLSHQEALLYVFEDNEAEIIIKVPQWDMFPGPTELRLIGCLTESIWTPRSKSITLIPTTNLPTF